jgi:hypothetical protein
MIKHLIKWFRMGISLSLLNERGDVSSGTTTTTLTETIPTAISASILAAQELDIVLGLVMRYDFPGAGIVHNTAPIAVLTAENDQDLANQAIDSGSVSAATMENTGSTVFLKELAMLGSVDDVMAVAGTLIGRANATARDKALCTLFVSFTQNEGAANTAIIVQDVFDAYNFLRKGVSPAPYNLVLHPGHIWSSKGLLTLAAATADANHYPYMLAGGVGSVGEEIARNGFSGRMFGFDIYADANVTVTSRDASGGAFSREAIKYVSKRRFRIDVEHKGEFVGWQVTGSEFFGSAVMTQACGDEMLFLTAA